MRVTAAARRRPVRCVADDSALSSVKVTVYNDMPRKVSPRGLPISSTGVLIQDRSTRTRIRYIVSVSMKMLSGLPR